MASKLKKPAAEPAEESDSEAVAAPAAGGWKDKLTNKWVLIGAGVALLAGAGGGGAFYMTSGAAKENAAAATTAPVKPVAFLDLPEVLVNLQSVGNERAQYLKVKITLELPDAGLSLVIQPVMPRVIDAFQTYLRELRPTDLDGSAGLYRLREEMTRRVNASIAPNRVNAVLFKEIVVQ